MQHIVGDCRPDNLFLFRNRLVLDDLVFLDYPVHDFVDFSQLGLEGWPFLCQLVEFSHELGDLSSDVWGFQFSGCRVST